MQRRRLIFPKGTDLKTERIQLAALGFSNVRNGNIVEIFSFRDTGIMQVSPEKFFRDLAKQGVTVEEI